jgi:hypothetical protein
MQRRKITSDTNDALFIRKRRNDGCTIVAKIVVVGWWAPET